MIRKPNSRFIFFGICFFLLIFKLPGRKDFQFQKLKSQKLTIQHLPYSLSHSDPQKVQELRTMLHEWRKKVHAKMPAPNPDYDSKSGWPAPSTKDES